MNRVLIPTSFKKYQISKVTVFSSLNLLFKNKKNNFIF